MMLIWWGRSQQLGKLSILEFDHGEESCNDVTPSKKMKCAAVKMVLKLENQEVKLMELKDYQLPIDWENNLLAVKALTSQQKQ